MKTQSRKAVGDYCLQQLTILFFAVFAALTAPAQTVKLVSAPGTFYGDDKQGNGILYNYEAYLISNNTASTLPSVYVNITNIAGTNLIQLGELESPVRPLGKLLPGETKMAAYFMKGPSLTGSDISINETHIIQVLDGPPGQGGSVLTNASFSYNNCMYVQEASANKVVIITNLNPRAVLGAVVPLVIGGNSGTVGSPPIMAFSPAVMAGWRPDAYLLESCVVKFDSLPSYTNTLYLDSSYSGFNPSSGGNYFTNTYYFRASKVTGSNVPVSPFGFIKSGGLIKHTALSSLSALGPTNSVIVSVTNAVFLNHVVSPTNLYAAFGATVTYTITISNTSSATVTMDQIVDALPGTPANASYVPNSATFNSLSITNPYISGQTLTWSLPFVIPPNGSSVMSFQAYAPYLGGQYTNTVCGVIGGETIGTTLDTSTNNLSLSTFTVIPVADVGVSKSAPANVYAASNFNYTITVTNIGPSPTTGLSVTDAIPAGLTYVSSVPPASVNGNVLTWNNLNPLAGGTSTNLIVTVKPGTVSAIYVNIASAGNTTLDPNADNNTSAPVVTTNIPVADIAVFKTGPASGISPFANFNYSILVTNYGPSTATGLMVTDALPANVTFVHASGGGALVAGQVVWSLGNLLAGAGTNLTLTVTSPDHGTVTNTATAVSATVDLVGTNNSTPAVITSVTNVPPVAVNDTAVTLPNTPVTIPVLANDSDANGDPLTIVAVTQTNGTAVISGTNVVFTPATNFTGNVVLTYTITDGFGGTNSAQIFITVSTLADLAIGKFAPTNVYSGGPLTYTISVTNFGPATASGVIVTDALPSGVTFVSASGGGVNNSGVVNWSLGDLASGQVTNLTLDVAAPANGILTNVATVGSTTGELNYTNNTTPPVTTSVTPSADVGLGKTAASTVLAGGELTYFIAVTNFGPNTAASVTVTDVLPANVGFVSAAGDGINNSGTVTWNLGDLANGAIINLSVTVSVPASGSLANSASVASPTSDPDSTNNVTPPVTTSITPVADLGIAKTGPASVVYGNNFDYTISVTNAGPSTATGIIVTDSLPANLVFVSAVPTAITNSGNQIVWTNLGDLASGQVTNLTLTVSSVSSGVVSNTASVSSPVSDPNPTNNTTPPVVTTVGLADPVVTWPTPADIVYGTALGTNENNAMATVPGTFDYNPANGVVLPAGTNTLTVLFTPTNTNYATTNLSVQLVVSPAPLSVTASNASRIYGQPNPVFDGTISGIQNGDNIIATYATSATASSPVGNYPIVPTLVDPNGRLVNYAVMTNNGTLTVSHAVLGITANDTNRLYNTANPTFTYTASGFVNGENASVLSGSPTLTTVATTGSPAGTYPIITTTGTLSATNYAFSFTNGVLTVNIASPLVTWPTPTNIVYGTALGTNENSATATVPGTFDYNPTNGTVLPAGTNLLSVAFTPTDTNYASTNLTVELVVDPAMLTITADNQGKVYGQMLTMGAGQTAFTSSGLVNGDSVTSVTFSSAGAVGGAAIGIYPIVPSAAVGSGLTNYSIAYSNGTLTVAFSTAVVTWPTPSSIVYGTPLSSLQNNATSSVPGTAVYNPANGTVLPAGTNTLTVVYTPTDTNYAATNLSVQLVVTPAPLSVTASNVSRTYGEPNPVLDGAISGIQNSDNITATYVTSATTNSPVGSYPIVPTLVDPNGRLANYLVTTNNGTLIVSKAVLVITANNTNRLYNTANPVFTYTASGFVNGESQSVLSGSPSLTTVATPGSPAGNYPITAAAGTLSATNYAFNFTNGVLTVNIASPVVTWPTPTSIIYGTPLSSLQNNATSSVPGTAVYNPANGAILSVGTNTLNVVYTPTDTNYAATNLSVQLVVTPALLGITANDTNRPYGAANPAFTYTVSGFVNGDTASVLSGSPSLTTTATTNSPVGIYPITAAAGTLSATNYVFGFTNGTLTVDYTGPMADVIVLLTGPATSIQGSNIVYHLVITNAGPNTSSNVMVSDSLPTNLLFVAASGNGLVVTNQATNSFVSYSLVTTNSPPGYLVTWPNIKALPAGGSTNYTLTVNAPQAGTFTDVASAVATTYDPNPTNNNGVSPSSQSQTIVAPVELGAVGSAPVVNPQTGLFEETATVTNSGAVTVLGFRLHVGGLTNGVTLYNATGTTNGVPYVDYLFPLDPSNSVSLILEFYDPLRRPFTNTLSVEPILPTSISLSSTNHAVAVSRVFTDTRNDDMRFVIEFETVPGKTYAVLYSTNLNAPQWNVATPSVTANATVTQWYDDGPPKTESKPASVNARYYRVLKF